MVVRCRVRGQFSDQPTNQGKAHRNESVRGFEAKRQEDDTIEPVLLRWSHLKVVVQPSRICVEREGFGERLRACRDG